MLGRPLHLDDVHVDFLLLWFCGIQEADLPVQLRSPPPALLSSSAWRRWRWAAPAATLQDDGGGEQHHGGRESSQDEEDDELDVRQAGDTALAHRHLQQPVVMATAVTAAPLVSSGGRVASHVLVPERRLTGVSGEATPTDALEARGSVEAASGVEAGPTRTVVHVDGAEASGEAGRTETREAVRPVHTGGARPARRHQTVVHVRLTAAAREARQAATRPLLCEAIGVFTQAAIFTRRPGDRRGRRGSCERHGGGPTPG